MNRFSLSLCVPLAALMLLMSPPAAGGANDIALDVPRANLDIDIMHALSLRKSTKEFSGREIGHAELSTILWAANGVNRLDGKRTAPAPFGKEIVDIYAVSDKGVYRHDARTSSLKFISGERIKGIITPQTGYAAAPVILVIVGKPGELVDTVKKKKDRVNYCYATAGAVAQNVYLAATAMGIGTVFAATMDRKAVAETLSLDKDRILIAIMPLGYPR